MARLTPADVAIDILGRCVLPSPVATHLGALGVHFVGAADRVLVDDSLSGLSGATGELSALPSFELAGPRDKIFFDPRTLRCGIVTCGGLAPGLNNVVRGIVLELWLGYGVRQILGFRYGYEGLISRFGHMPLMLTPETVAHIHHEGGTMLGSSRGSQDPAEMVDNLEANGIGILFVIGGDGTMNGAVRVCAEIARRGLRIGVVGIPKTIDNDVPFIDRSFGYVTAYSAAVDVIRSARIEAMGARDGIGLVKLMGRHSGFLACHAALASTEADVVLIPEVPIALGGERGVYACIDRVLARKGHAVVVVAEGAAQELIADQTLAEARDKSGNAKLKDIGVFLRDAISAVRSALERGEPGVNHHNQIWVSSSTLSAGPRNLRPATRIHPARQAGARQGCATAPMGAGYPATNSIPGGSGARLLCRAVSARPACQFSPRCG